MPSNNPKMVYPKRGYSKRAYIEGGWIHERQPMPKSAFTDAYVSVVAKLVALRQDRGVSQVELARRLGKTQQFVSKVERGDRRIDVIEFYAIVKALGADPEAVFASVTRKLPDKVAI